MFDKSKRILMVIVFSCIFVSFNGCKLTRSPISMVRNHHLEMLGVTPGKWYSDDFSSPTWNRLIEEYKYFANYSSSNWSEKKLDKQEYVHLVSYSTKFNNNVNEQYLGGFIINNKKIVPVNDVLLYFKKGIMLSEKRTYAGINIIYSPQDKARILEVITLLESGDVTDITFNSGHAVLRWVTNKIADKEYENEVAFLGTFIIADITLKKKDGTESTYENFVFYTTPEDPIDPYKDDKPYSFY